MLHIPSGDINKVLENSQFVTDDFPATSLGELGDSPSTFDYWRVIIFWLVV